MTSSVNIGADWPNVSHDHQGSRYMSVVQYINDEQMVSHILIVLKA